MTELVLGTNEGVFAFHLDSGKFHAEDGPDTSALLAAAGDGGNVAVRGIATDPRP